MILNGTEIAEIFSSDMTLLDEVQARIYRRLNRVLSPLGVQDGWLCPGKMLRTRMASRLWASGACQVPGETIVAACAATELVHTASLCHDDIIDESPLRRHRPALWTLTGRPAAVLTGDLLLCEAMDVIQQAQGGRYVASFMAKVRQVVEAEIRQELLHRGRTPDVQACIGVAREKTGPLFAFIAEVCAGGETALRAALEEGGYLLGTAYQLADDLIDVTGQEGVCGKVLGTDVTRGKFTLAQEGPDSLRATAKLVEALLCDAVAKVRPWRPAREGLESYVEQDLMPVLSDQGVTLAWKDTQK